MVKSAIEGFEVPEAERVAKELVNFHKKAQALIAGKELEEGYCYTIRDLKQAANFINNFKDLQ